MSIADHVGILLMSSLDQARESKAKPGKIEFYARVALPPTAQADLMAACTAVAPNGSLGGLQLAPKLHSSLAPDKQFAGIPLDWFIVRMSSGEGYPPELFAESGEKLTAIPLNASRIRTDFYAGQRVRVNTYGFFYPPKNGGSAGIGFNLSGLMAVGGGERRGGDQGEPSESAFAKYRSEPANTGGNAFGGATSTNDAVQNTSTAGSTGDNPFQQGSTGNTAANPFG